VCQLFKCPGSGPLVSVGAGPAVLLMHRRETKPHPLPIHRQMASNTSNTSNTSRKTSPVKVVKVDPAQLVGTLSQDALAALIQSAQAAKAAAQAAKAAKAAKVSHARISLSDAARAAADTLGWPVPYTYGKAEFFSPEARIRFNVTPNTPMYDSILSGIKAHGGVEFGDIAQLYVALNSGDKIRSFAYILQQACNRAGERFKVIAGRVTIDNG